MFFIIVYCSISLRLVRKISDLKIIKLMFNYFYRYRWSIRGGGSPREGKGYRDLPSRVNRLYIQSYICQLELSKIRILKIFLLLFSSKKSFYRIKGICKYKYEICTEIFFYYLMIFMNLYLCLKMYCVDKNIKPASSQ